MYYCVFLFQQAGLAGTAALLLANGLQGVVLNLAVLPNMYYMDVWGTSEAGHRRRHWHGYLNDAHWRSYGYKR